MRSSKLCKMYEVCQGGLSRGVLHHIWDTSWYICKLRLFSVFLLLAELSACSTVACGSASVCIDDHAHVCL